MARPLRSQYAHRDSCSCLMERRDVAAAMASDEIELLALETLVTPDGLPAARATRTHSTLDRAQQRAPQLRPKARVKPKAQIESLRLEVVRLEQQLSDWRAFWKQTAALKLTHRQPNSSECTDTIATPQGPWTSIAVQQQRALDAAKCENQDLREQVQSKRELLRRMRKLLTRRAADAKVS